MSKINDVRDKTGFIALCVICLTISTIGVSYSMFFEVKTPSETNVITTGSLAVSFNSDSSTIFENGILPVSDLEGLQNASQSIVYIQNDSKIPSSFVIAVGNNKEKVGDSNVVPFEYIKMAIFEYDPVTRESTQISSVINLADCVFYEAFSGDTLNDKLIVYRSSVDGSSSGNNTKSLSIKVWLDQDADESISNSVLNLNLHVISEATGALTEYSLNGVLQNEDSVLSDATISIDNNFILTTTNSNGEFSISTLREGVYSMKITLKDGSEYYETIEIAEGADTLLSQYATSYTVTDNMSLNNVAYSYNTTINGLLSKNSFTGLSNNISLVNGSNVNLPNVYKITGGSDEAISEITITLDGDSISSMRLDK